MNPIVSFGSIAQVEFHIVNPNKQERKQQKPRNSQKQNRRKQRQMKRQTLCSKPPAGNTISQVAENTEGLEKIKKVPASTFQKMISRISDFLMERNQDIHHLPKQHFSSEDFKFHHDIQKYIEAHPDREKPVEHDHQGFFRFQKDSIQLDSFKSNRNEIKSITQLGIGFIVPSESNKTLKTLIYYDDQKGDHGRNFIAALKRLGPDLAKKVLGNERLLSDKFVITLRPNQPLSIRNRELSPDKIPDFLSDHESTLEDEYITPGLSVKKEQQGT